MTTKLLFPQIVTGGEPASLSKTFLTDILRGELGYEGLIITDDMMMNGATSWAGSLSAAFRMAIEAGNDIIISSTTAQLNENLWTANLRLMQTSQEFRNRVIDAAHRVVLAKLRYFKSDNAVPIYPELDKINERIPDPDGQVFFLEQACRSVTLYHGDESPLLPEKDDDILLVGQKQFPSFFSEGFKRYPGAKRMEITYGMGPNSLAWMTNLLISMAPQYKTVVICVADEASAQLAAALKDIPVETIIISVLAPYPAMELKEWADKILMIYSYSPYSFNAVFGALHGEFVPRGTFPLIE